MSPAAFDEDEWPAPPKDDFERAQLRAELAVLYYLVVGSLFLWLPLALLGVI